MRSETFFKDIGVGRRVLAWAVPLVVCGFIFLGQLIALLAIKFSGLIGLDELDAYPYVLLMLFGVFGTVFLLLWLWLKLFEKRPLTSVGLTLGGGAGRDFGTGFLIGLIMAALSVALIWLWGGYTVEAGSLWQPSLLTILLLLFGFGVQSSVEEIVFRGWMFSRLTASFGLWVGVLGNALLFTVLHLNLGGDGPFYLIGFLNFACMTMAFSVLTSFLVIRQKSVWGACAWHAAWNWSFITGFGLPTTGLAIDMNPLWVDLAIAEGAPVWLTGGTMGPEDSILTTVVLIVACLLLRPRRQDLD